LFIRASLEAGALCKSCHAKAGMKLVLGPVFVESLWRGFTPDATVVIVDKLASKPRRGMPTASLTTRPACSTACARAGSRCPVCFPSTLETRPV
jgi:hypothetical protein